MADYRAGIVGCGHIARVHAGGYRATGGVNLVAAADIVPEALGTFGEEWGVEGRYTDYAEMLAQEKLDILSVCTRNHQHVEPTLAAAEAGVRAIFCEKPMAMNLGEADRMVGACERAGVKLTVDHTMRFEANYVHIKERIEQGAIGELLSVEVRAIGDLGELTHNATHSFDTLCMFGGEPEWMFAHLERDVERNQEREDLFALVGFANGVRGKLTYGGYTNYRYEGFVWEGTEGRIEAKAGNGWLPQVRYWTHDQPGETEFRDGTPIPTQENDPWEAAIGEVVAGLDENRESISDGCAGRRALSMTMAAYESRRQGGVRIQFPYDIQESPLDMMLESGELPKIWGRGVKEWT